MPYPTILTQAQLAAHIQTTLTNINNGLYAYNQTSGQAVWMPTEIKFDNIVIDQFQALSVITNEGGTSTMAQTGTDSTVQTGTESMVQTGTDTSTTASTTTDTTTQTTTHGESSSTTDADQTEYVGYDPSVSLAGGDSNSPTIGRQSQPFPL